MKQIITILLCTIALHAFSNELFWIGGNGNFSDVDHWSLTSGGAASGIAPSAGDTIHFDINSGLTAASVITVDVNIEVHSIFMNTLPTAITFNSTAAGNPIITGSFVGNASGVIFIGTWNTFNINPIGIQIFNSGGIIWPMSFDIDGDTVNFVNNFNINNNSITVTSGVVNFPTAITITCGTFLSNNNNEREITIEGDTVYVNLGTWNLGGTNLTLNGNTSTIFIGNSLGMANFSGGDQTYGTVRSNSATALLLPTSSTINLLELTPSSTTTINSGVTIIFDSLVTFGNCSSPKLFNKAGAGINPILQKSGFPDFSLRGTTISNIDASTTGEAFIVNGAISGSSSGWTEGTGTLYWIGNSGNWNNGNRWSFSSGGAASGCIPTIQDSVIFDNLSFTLAGQQVSVTDTAFAKVMLWQNLVNPQSLVLDSNIYIGNDIILDPNLSVLRSFVEAGILQTGAGSLTANNAELDVNLYLKANNITDVWSLSEPLEMSDSASLLLINGRFQTNNNNLKIGNILSVDDPDDTTDERQLILGSSTVRVAQRFSTFGDDDFTLSAGTSHLIIADSGNYDKALLTQGLNFHDVTLYFKKLEIAQTVGGDNSFNKLRILAGSHIDFVAGSTQTINDSLIVVGTCSDSIYLRTTGPGQTNFQKLGGSTYRLECINYQGINASTGVNLQSFFSSNLGSNSNITFSPLQAANANFSPVGPYCFGDTTFFNNTSTAISGNTNDLTFNWYFNDGSGMNPADTIFYFTNVNSHVFLISDSIPVILEAIYLNGCRDYDTNYVNISRPQFFSSTNTFASTVCPGHLLEITSTSGDPNMQFNYFLNGDLVLSNLSSDSIPYTTTSLSHQDTIEVFAFDGTCFADTSYIFTFGVHPVPTYNFSSSVNPAVICAGDNVTFTGSSAQALDYRFLINNTSVSPFQSGAGNYSTSSLVNNDEVYMIVRDGFNCVDTSATISFTVNPLPNTTLSHSASGNAICAGDEITFTAAGASLYEFYIGSTLVQGPSALATCAIDTISQGHVINVIGISADGCSAPAPQTFTYFVTPSPNTAITSNIGTQACEGQEIIFTGQGATLYEFFVNGTPVQALSTNSTFVSSTLNDGDVISVYGEALGCSATSSALTMEIFPAPSTSMINSLGATSLCSGTLVEFTASGASTYQFFVNGVSQGAPSASNNFSSSTLSNGDIVAVSGSIGVCTNSAQQQFTVLPNPVVSVFSNNPTNTVCDGDPITITASGAQNYTFIQNGTPVQGPGTASTLVNPGLGIGSNQIEVIGLASNGCSSTSNQLIIINNPIPTVNISSSIPSNEICAGDMIVFTSSGANNYQFLLNGSPQTSLSSNNSFSSTSILNGNIISVLGESNGCSNTSTGIAITVNPIPSISLNNSIGSNQYCEDQFVTYTASGASNYEFIVNGNSQGPSSPLNEITSNDLPVGLVNLLVIGESAGCTANTNTNVTIFPLPVANIQTSTGLTEFCSNENVVFEASGGSQYQFILNGLPVTTNSFINNYSSSSLSSGDIVSVNVTSNAGCSASATMPPLTIFPTPNIAISSSNGLNNICVGDEVIVTASGGLNYEFFLNGVSIGAPSPLNEVALNNLTTGDVVNVIGSDANCDATSNSISFTSFGIPLVSLSNNSPSNVVCVDEPIDITASGAANYQFLLNGNPVGGFSANNNFNQIVSNGDVVTVIGELNGCNSTPSNPLAFTVFNYPVLSVINNTISNTICVGDTVEINASGAMTYAFSVNGLLTETNSSGVYISNELLDNDQVSVIGFNAHCASAVDNAIFTVNSMNLSLNVLPSPFVCFGENLEFTAGGADEYAFLINNIVVQGPDANFSFTSSNLDNHDQVSVVGYNNTTNCAQPLGDYIVVSIVDEPQITASGVLEFCEGDSVELFSNSTYGNQWYLNGNPITGATNNSLIVTESGDYSLDIQKGGNGEVWSIGKNSSGIHGNGNNFNSPTPDQALFISQIENIVSGYEFILAKTFDGNVYTWGKNSSGQLGNGTFTSANSPILLSGVSDIKAIATARSSAMAITNDGDVYVWGENNSGQLGLGNLSIVNFPMLNPSINNVDTIAGGLEHFIILRNDGTVWTVGNNLQGQLGNNSIVNSSIPVQVTGLTDIVRIGAGEYHSFAIDNNGLLFVWGNNSSGQLGLGDLTARLTPTPLALPDIVAATGGANHSVFLNANGKVYATGGNTFGQLGNGTQLATTTPKTVSVSGVQQIAANQYNTLFLRQDGSVFGCGNNAEGQLSPLSTTIVSTPSHLNSFEGATFVSASQLSTHIIYGNNQLCSANAASVVVNEVPPATITVNGDELTTIPGVSYQWFLNGLPIPLGVNQTFIATVNGNYSVSVTLPNGCNSNSEIYWHQLANIGVNTIEKIRVYPNPTESTLTIDEITSGFENISIIDNAGRVVINEFIPINTTKIELDVKKLARGSYQLLLSGKENIYRTIFIKN